MILPAETFRSMSPLDLHVLSTPPAFVLSQDQTLMFNPYPQRFAYSRPARQSRPLSPIRQGVSLFQNLTVLYNLISLCIVFKNRSLPLASVPNTVAR